jgi:patatin-like phospholipase/acyl hydrolase
VPASPPKRRPFRILSLDGGGIRGAFIASYLAEIESNLGRPLHEHFDLIAGTSTGGIIALAIAMGEPASRILDIYREKGPAIFTRRKPLPVRTRARPVRWAIDRMAGRYGFDYDSMRQPKYSSAPLSAALQDVFGDRTLESAKTRILIPAVDLVGGKTVVFKTPHQPNFIRDRKYKVVDIALATSAAPVYFSQAVLAEGTAYIDGGVWANNPSLVSYVEAAKLREICTRPVDPDFQMDDLIMLSVGTGKSSLLAVPPRGGAGLGWWACHLLNVVTISQAQGVDFQMKYLLGSRYERVNFTMPDQPWMLDDIARLDALIHHGKEQATATFPDLKPVYFSGERHNYTPFPL